MGFSRQQYWSGLPFPSPGDLPNPGIELGSSLQADSLPSEPPVKPKKVKRGVKSLGKSEITEYCDQERMKGKVHPKQEGEKQALWLKMLEA